VKGLINIAKIIGINWALLGHF